MEIVEFGDLSEVQRAQLEGNEPDPFDSARNDLRSWRAKDRHVGLRAADGRLVASTGLLIAEIEVDGKQTNVVGLGGVIVAAPYRGRGLSNRIIDAALRAAATLGPDLAMLFCYRDRAGLYERHGFVEIPPPVLVEQPEGFVQIPLVSMWRSLRDRPLPTGRVRLRGFPF